MLNDKMANSKDISKLIETLSPIEKRVLPHLSSKIEDIPEKSGLDMTTVVRALEFLQNKGIIKLAATTTKIIDLGTNGIYYKKNHLPERKLLMALENSKPLSLQEAKDKSGLSENEFKVSLGVLKKKALINLTNGKLSLNASKEELVKKSLEEQFLDLLPIDESALTPEQRYAFENLKSRKDIVEVSDRKEISFSITEIGTQIVNKPLNLDLLEEVTPDVIKAWNRNKKFRRYDIQAPVPKIYGGKKHFVNQAQEYARRIWSDMGFKEMAGTITATGFWNFDALFTAQDHPVRELQDTFFIKKIEGKLPDKSIVDSVKKSHEEGIEGSKGWQYKWKESEAKKVLLRTHTTCLSAQTLASLRNLKNKTGKFFAVGKCFRNETLDWSHGFEFNQTEGIVVDKNANFLHLLGYLKEFYKKMGFENVKFVPSYFPYTEPSVEIYVWHKERKVWLEVGGAGIFRPEVVVPLLGEYVPVLAWGPGFDRAIMEYYEIKDLREMYENDIKKLREKKVWIK